MRVEFIAIGSELLSRSNIESNSFHLQKALQELGVGLSRKTVVPDDRAEIMNILNEAMSRSDIVICSGGLGPTEDDRTIAVVAEYCNKRVELNEKVWSDLKRRLETKGRSANEGHKKLSHVVEGAELLENGVGQAPGEYLRINNKHLILLPGVQREFIHILNDSVLPRLKELTGQKHAIRLMTFKFAAIPEAILDMTVRELLAPIDFFRKEDLIITTSPGIQTITIPAMLEENIYKQKRKLLEDLFIKSIPDHFYASGDLSLEEVTGEIARKKGITVSTAESCTGGLLASRITDIPGASEYFAGGVITYSNELKVSVLGVRRETLDEHGAVSEQVAREMALGLLNRYSTDVTLSITGIAGPTGGTKEKPVGTVYIAVADQKGIEVKRNVIDGERRFFKEWVTSVALNMLRLRLLRFH